MIVETQHNLLLGLDDPLPSESSASGFVKFPYSSDNSAYGFIPMPITVLGPPGGTTVLVLAGSHGDEAECQIALTRVIQSLDPETMRGRLIALTMANEPAARVGRRNSPVDGANLNRSYPGSVFGSPTSMIADYIEHHLMSQCDVVLDLHGRSGSFDHIPCATVVHHPDIEERVLRLSLAMAFGTTVMLSHSFEERNSSGAAKRAGAVRIGTEISGPDAVQTIFDGVLNTLVWAGVIAPRPDRTTLPGLQDVRPEPQAVRIVYPVQHYLYGLENGLFEPAVRLGDWVRAGQRAGLIYDASRPFVAPHEVMFTLSGQVACLRPAGLTTRGDCLLHIAVEADEQLLAEVAQAADASWLQEVPQRRRPAVRPPQRKRLAGDEGRS